MHARKIFITVLVSTIIFGGFAVPLVSAWVPGQQLVPCGNPPADTHGSVQQVANPCGFDDLIVLIGNLTQFLLFIAIFAATLMFAWAGFLMISAQGSEAKVSKAKGMFWTAGIGLILMASAWLIIQVIITTFGAERTAGRYLDFF